MMKKFNLPPPRSTVTAPFFSDHRWPGGCSAGKISESSVRGISFGLVSIPVELYSAIEDHNIRFHLLHKKCGSRGY